MHEIRNARKILVGKALIRRPLGISRRKVPESLGSPTQAHSFSGHKHFPMRFYIFAQTSFLRLTKYQAVKPNPLFN
jgi:hypothetical protein